MDETLYLVIEDLDRDEPDEKYSSRFTIKGLYRSEAEAVKRASEILRCPVDDLNPSERFGDFVKAKDGSLASRVEEIEKKPLSQKNRVYCSYYRHQYWRS